MYAFTFLPNCVRIREIGKKKIQKGFEFSRFVKKNPKRQKDCVLVCKEKNQKDFWLINAENYVICLHFEELYLYMSWS